MEKHYGILSRQYRTNRRCTATVSEDNSEHENTIIVSVSKLIKALRTIQPFKKVKFGYFVLELLINNNRVPFKMSGKFQKYSILKYLNTKFKPNCVKLSFKKTLKT